MTSVDDTITLNKLKVSKKNCPFQQTMSIKASGKSCSLVKNMHTLYTSMRAAYNSKCLRGQLKVKLEVIFCVEKKKDQEVKIIKEFLAVIKGKIHLGPNTNKVCVM